MLPFFIGPSLGGPAKETSVSKGLRVSRHLSSYPNSSPSTRTSRATSSPVPDPPRGSWSPQGKASALHSHIVQPALQTASVLRRGLHPPARPEQEQSRLSKETRAEFHPQPAHNGSKRHFPACLCRSSSARLHGTQPGTKGSPGGGGPDPGPALPVPRFLPSPSAQGQSSQSRPRGRKA